METGYAYDPISMAFEKISKEAMIRAVRVKNSLKGKLQKHLTFGEKKELTFPVEESVSTSLSNEAESENLGNKLDLLVAQGKVPTEIKRMVLYTKELAAKSERVMNKTYAKKEEEVVSPTELEIDSSGVVSDSWDNELPKNEMAEEAKEVEMPNLEESKQEVPEETNEEIDIPTSWDLDVNLENELPKEEVNNEIPPVDIEINAEIPSNFTLEPKEIEQATIEEPKTVEEVASDITFEVENEPKEISYDNLPSQSAVVAKARRFSNLLSEANAKNSDLQSKVNTLEIKYSEAKDKNHVLESFVKDVVKENTRLVGENAQLKNDKEKLENDFINYTETAKSEHAIASKSHADEIAKLQEEINLLKEQNRNDKEKMNLEFNERLRNEEEKHKRAMKALYATISETLVEPIEVEEPTEEMTKVA